MAKSYMELIYIDSGDQACKTNLHRQCETDAETWATFRSYRKYSVDYKQARFLLDYHNAKGDLGDTIAVDEAGFRAITGMSPKTEADYRKIDSEFWRDARSAAA